MKKNQFVILFISCSIIAIVLVFAFVFSSSDNRRDGVVSLPETIEIADTDEKRALGLSFRENIPPDYGMFFTFPQSGMYGFWMKNMLVPIDIIWIDAKGKIVHIDESVSPDTYPTIFYPPTSIQYVLEIKAGEADRLGFEEGVSMSLMCTIKR